MADGEASEDQVARLRLIRSDNIGSVTYFQLLARFGTEQAALAAIPDLAARGGGRVPRLVARSVVEREIEAVARLGSARVTCSSARVSIRRCWPSSRPRRRR